MRPSVAIFSPISTFPIYSGSRARINQIARAFKSRKISTYLVTGRNQRITQQARCFWDQTIVLDSRVEWKPNRGLDRLDSWYSSSLGPELAEVTAKAGANMVWFNYAFHSKALDFFDGSISKIIDLHDRPYDRNRLLSHKRQNPRFFSCSESDERTYLERADLSITMSELERLAIGSSNPDLRLLSLPYFAERWDRNDLWNYTSNRKRLFGYIAGANDINVYDLSNLVNIVDSVFQGRPPFKVVLVGRLVDFILRRQTRFMPLLARRWIALGPRTLDQASLMKIGLSAWISPGIVGTGGATKFSESIATGLPVLSTVAGSRSYESRHPLHNLDPEQLVFIMGKIQRDELFDLREAGLENLERTAETFSERFDGVINMME